MGDGARPFSDREGEGSTECSALRRADRFALYFVECNASAFCQTGANALRERLDRPVMDVEIGDVERSPTRPAIDFILEQRLVGVPDEVVTFVWGFNHLLRSTENGEAMARPTILNEMNWRREAWAWLGHGQEGTEYAQRYYDVDRGWTLIQEVFPDADILDDASSPSEP